MDSNNKHVSHSVYLLFFLMIPRPPISTLFPYTTLFRSQDNHEYPFLYQRQTCHQVQPNQATYQKRQKCQPDLVGLGGKSARSEERFSRNAETDLVCRLLLEKKNYNLIS